MTETQYIILARDVRIISSWIMTFNNNKILELLEISVFNEN